MTAVLYDVSICIRDFPFTMIQVLVLVRPARAELVLVNCANS